MSIQGRQHHYDIQIVNKVHDEADPYQAAIFRREDGSSVTIKFMPKVKESENTRHFGFTLDEFSEDQRAAELLLRAHVDLLEGIESVWEGSHHPQGISSITEIDFLDKTINGKKAPILRERNIKNLLNSVSATGVAFADDPDVQSLLLSSNSNAAYKILESMEARNTQLSADLKALGSDVDLLSSQEQHFRTWKMMTPMFGEMEEQLAAAYEDYRKQYEGLSAEQKLQEETLGKLNTTHLNFMEQIRELESDVSKNKGKIQQHISTLKSLITELHSIDAHMDLSGLEKLNRAWEHYLHVGESFRNHECGNTALANALDTLRGCLQSTTDDIRDMQGKLTNQLTITTVAPSADVQKMQQAVQKELPQRMKNLENQIKFFDFCRHCFGPEINLRAIERFADKPFAKLIASTPELENRFLSLPDADRQMFTQLFMRAFPFSQKNKESLENKLHLLTVLNEVETLFTSFNLPKMIGVKNNKEVAKILGEQVDVLKSKVKGLKGDIKISQDLVLPQEKEKLSEINQTLEMKAEMERFFGLFNNFLAQQVEFQNAQSQINALGKLKEDQLELKRLAGIYDELSSIKAELAQLQQVAKDHPDIMACVDPKVDDVLDTGSSEDDAFIAWEPLENQHWEAPRTFSLTNSTDSTATFVSAESESVEWPSPSFSDDSERELNMPEALTSSVPDLHSIAKSSTVDSEAVSTPSSSESRGEIRTSNAENDISVRRRANYREIIGMPSSDGSGPTEAVSSLKDEPLPRPTESLAAIAAQYMADNGITNPEVEPPASSNLAQKASISPPETPDLGAIGRDKKKKNRRIADIE